MLKLMYITNQPEIAAIAEEYSVDRIFVDLETLGKEERQAGMNTVKSRHSREDVSAIRQVIHKAELLVRVNPLHEGSAEEISEVIDRGADIVMLPMFRTAAEARTFVQLVGGRAKTMLLLETKEAEAAIDEILAVDGIDEIHIGLNDLHISHGMDFLFQPLANGMVDALAEKIKAAGIPFGFGGIARLDEGMLPARFIIAEHHRLGSEMVILSRSFYDAWLGQETEEIRRVFQYGVKEIREFEQRLETKDAAYFQRNREIVITTVDKIAANIRAKKQHAARMTTPQPVAVNQLDYETLNHIGESYGESFYLLDTDQYAANFQELHQAFASRYPKFAIAYSYKTNYIPAICQRLDQLGGYAEVVSRMEWEIARRCGVPARKVIFNGPFKHADAVEGLLVSGGVVNIDSLDELPMLEEIARRNPAATLHMGIRVNFDIGDGVISRFGVDADSDLPRVLDFLADHSNMELTSLQCHFATRRLDTWAPRAQGMLALIDKHGLKPKMVDLGGGLFGKMHDSLKAQFTSPIPTYEEYAEAAASLFAAHYADVPEDEKPLLLIEPGSALSGDVMRFCCKVKTIKQVRGHAIATVLGSVYNINPTLNGKNPPLEVFHCGKETSDYQDVNVGGFTCIESDYLYKGYQGPLAQGDYLVFGNVGSYSVVLKPPFILPNFAVVDKAGGITRQVKRPEDFDDLFATYAF